MDLLTSKPDVFFVLELSSPLTDTHHKPHRDSIEIRRKENSLYEVAVINSNNKLQLSLLKRINLSSILTQYRNAHTFNDTTTQDDMLYQRLLFNKFYIGIIGYKVYIIHINHELQKIFIFSQKKLNLVKIIDLSFFKKVKFWGKVDLALQFFPGFNMEVLYLKFISHRERELFICDLLPSFPREVYSRLHKKKLSRVQKIILLSIARNNMDFLKFLITTTHKILKRRKLIYLPDIYDLVDMISQQWTEFPGKRSLSTVLFLFSCNHSLEKVYKILFYPMSNVKYEISQIRVNYQNMLKKWKTHRDSMWVAKMSQSSSEEKMIEEAKRSNKNLSIHLSLGSNGEDECGIKKRPRHNRIVDIRFNGNSRMHPTRISFESESIKSVGSKPEFDTLYFNVFILRYFAKDSKILEVNSNGTFMLYRKGKSDLTTYLLTDITNMEGLPNSNYLNITIKDVKKVIYLEFSSPLEKYLFKSIAYTFFLLNLPRYHISNQIMLNVNIITWNLAGIDVPSDLGIMFNHAELKDLDLLTIGVQECSIFKSKDWQKHLKTLLGYYGFAEVTSIDMCQMFLILFAKRELMPYIDTVESSYKPMGFAGVIGNKGGIVISCKLMGYHLVFVNCHLAPKPYKVLERNKMAKTMIKTIKLADKFADFDVLADYIFWQGDLNYRIDFTFDETIEELKKDNIKLLLSKDQLIKQRQLNFVFYDFQEPEISFIPTYRRKRGKEEYSNKNNQSPSWCDRIMVKTQRDIDLLFYDSLKHMKHSDHLPVESKYSIYLTMPIIEDVEKAFDQGVIGNFVYTNITLSYDFIEAFAEFEIELRFPLKMKIECYYFINKIHTETKTFEVKNELVLENNLMFDELVLPIPPQFIFDLPHARAFNIFFVVKIIMYKTFEIGFGKYSLENIERENMNILSHSYSVDITWRMRKFGTLSFNAAYKI